jgi:hypothetical protein
VLTLAAGLAEGLGRSMPRAWFTVTSPSNVLLASDGLRIIDFGILRAAMPMR